MGESYEQGIEKALVAFDERYIVPDPVQFSVRECIVAAVEAFLSAQPTEDYCKSHGQDHEMLGTADGPCDVVEVQIVERETP